VSQPIFGINRAFNSSMAKDTVTLESSRWGEHPAIEFRLHDGKKLATIIVGRVLPSGFHLHYIYSTEDRHGYGERAVRALKTHFRIVHAREVRSPMGQAFCRKMQQKGLIASVRSN
jgi:hypothetical protein